MSMFIMTAKKSSRKRSRSAEKRRNKNSNVKTIIILAVIALVIIIAAIYLYIGSNDNQNNGNATEGNPIAVFDTTLGTMKIELYEDKVPNTIENFIKLTNDGFYDGLVFHRVIDDFMIQGGGFTAYMGQKQTRPPIVNEASNGLKNDRGTIAMARTNDPDSATSQFFINHKDNDFLNYVEGRNPGYAIFGRTVEGMDVVDKIAAVKTTVRSGMRDVPVETVLIKSAKVVSEK